MNHQKQQLEMKNMQMVLVPLDQLKELVKDCITDGLKALGSSLEDQPVTENGSDLLTRNEAAKLLGVSKGTVDNYARDGHLPKKKVGVRSVRFTREDVLKLARFV